MRLIALIIFLLPILCKAQQVTGISEEVYFRLRKQSLIPGVSTTEGHVAGMSGDFYISIKKQLSFPIDKYTPEVLAISQDFYINFSKRVIKPIVIYSESVDFPVALKKTMLAVKEADKQKVVPEILIAETKVAEKKETPAETGNVKVEKVQVKPDPKKSTPESQKPVTEKKEEKIAVAPQQTEIKKPSSVTSSEAIRTPAVVQAKAVEPLVKNEPRLPNYHALIIGVSNYKYSGTGIGNLERPVIDATTLATTLSSHYHFNKADIHLLKDATRADIIDELEVLASKLTEKDNLIIFYAGHGFWDENLEIGYWLPSDAQPTKKSSWIGNSTIKDYISGMKTKHTLLISDACFSGSIFKVREVDVLNESGVSKLYQLPSRKAMTSGNMKTVPDKSKFFEYFNKRLLENEDAYLSARQLFQNFYVAVINNTNTVPQYGVIQEAGDEGGEFIFIKRQ